MSTYHRIIQTQEEAAQNVSWENFTNFKHSKVFLGNFKKQKAKTILELSKNRLRVLIAFLTGHCRLRKHMARINLKQNSRFCGRTKKFRILYNHTAITEIHANNLRKDLTRNLGEVMVN